MTFLLFVSFPALSSLSVAIICLVVRQERKFAEREIVRADDLYCSYKI